MPRHVSFILVLLFLLVFVRPAQADAYRNGRASFHVLIRNEVFDYRISPLFVLPGESVRIEIPGRGARCRAERGELVERSMHLCEWKAPNETGSYQVAFESADDRMLLHAFVMVPFSELRQGRIKNYMMGSYPSPEESGKAAAYELPEGFIEVTPENESLLISPHFTLSQFLCKQASGYPKYIVLKEALLLKLERLLEEVNRLGRRVDTFHIMSGFRTPNYNQLIENVRYSRHVFGDAADIYLPYKHEELLRKNGRKDVHLLSQVVERLEKSSLFRRFTGGMGVYAATPQHPPFLHVDVRGWKARW